MTLNKQYKNSLEQEEMLKYQTEKVDDDIKELVTFYLVQLYFKYLTASGA
jgi:hypothetical protein